MYWMMYIYFFKKYVDYVLRCCWIFLITENMNFLPFIKHLKNAEEYFYLIYYIFSQNMLD